MALPSDMSTAWNLASLSDDADNKNKEITVSEILIL